MKTLLILLLCMSSHSFAQSEAIRQCLSKSGVVPLQILAKTSIPKKDLDMTLFTICDEMDDPKYEDTPAHFAQIDPWYDQAVSVVGATFSGIYKEAIAALAEGLTGSDAQLRYRAHLNMIRKIKDPYQRIYRVFNLARASQGEYKPILNLIRNPGQIIDAAAAGKPGGICREFALLLSFSLKWVARPDGDTIPAHGGLGPNSFNVSVKYSMQHAWVRVHLPRYEGNRLVGFDRFDLDSTWHDKFIPLNPRRTGEERVSLQNKYNRCMKATECVNRLP